MAGTGGRKNSHDVADYPLFTKDEYEKLCIAERLYNSLIFTGDGVTIEEWAAAVGKSERTVRRWLDDPSVMKSADVEATCKLLGISLDSLLIDSIYLNGGVYRFPFNYPTPAERGRHEPRAIAKAYSKLNENDQRLVTALIDTLRRAEIEAEEAQRAEDKYRSLVEKLALGEITEENADALQHAIWEEDHIDDKTEEEIEANWDEFLNDQRARVSELKERFYKQSAQLKKEREQQDASSTSDGIMDELC